MKISIIDYGAANIGSIVNMVQKVGYSADIVTSRNKLLSSDKIILPGIGSYDSAIRRLTNLDLIDPLFKVREKGIPILGICLGMQIMMESSCEGMLKGLGWIKGEVVRFNSVDMAADNKIPHMRWNIVSSCKPNVLFDSENNEERFYFAHSYHAVCNDQEDVLTYTTYGYPFVSSINRDNIIGVQFHPEKSHVFGMRMLYNYIHYFNP